MTAFRLNDAEQAILRRSELSHPARLLYVLGIRPHMDFATGIAGKRRRISYQGLHEVLEFVPEPGSQRERQDYSRKMLIRLIDELERHGLVRRLPNDFRAIFLECPVADREDASKNRMGTGRAVSTGSSMGTPEPNNDAGFGEGMGTSMGTSEEGRMGTPPVYRVNQHSVVNGLPPPYAVPVDNFGVVVAADYASWLRRAEHGRGCINRVRDHDPVLRAWAEAAIPMADIEAAYREAAWDRERHNSPMPIAPAFVDTILRRTLKGRDVGKGVQRRRPAEWHQTPEGISAKAAELGLKRRDGEDEAHLKSRIWFHLAHGQKGQS